MPTAVEMTALEAGVTYTASFFVTAEGGAVTYTAAEPASEDADYSISIVNPSGTLATGAEEEVTVDVTVIDDIADPYITVTSSGSATVTFAYPPVRTPPPCASAERIAEIPVPPPCP